MKKIGKYWKWFFDDIKQNQLWLAESESNRHVYGKNHHKMINLIEKWQKSKFWILSDLFSAVRFYLKLFVLQANFDLDS